MDIAPVRTADQAASALVAHLDRLADGLAGPADVDLPPEILRDLGQHCRGPALGMSPADVPDGWLQALAWAGMPFAFPGTTLWQQAIMPAAVAEPVLDQGILRLPPWQDWPALTSLSLRPVRTCIAEHFGYRLQCAAGIRSWRWPSAIFIVSMATAPVGGFVHGPEVDQRNVLSVQPGGYQCIAF